MIVTASATTILHRDLIIAAARHKLPAVYSFRDFVTMGGLISVALILPTGFGARLATSAASPGE